MKSTKFQWQQFGREPQDDPLMTRCRAARMIRAWRNSKTQGRRNFTLNCSRMADRRVYNVSTVGYYVNEYESMIIFK